MVETVFERSYSAIESSCRRARGDDCDLHGLPTDSRRDLEQEALLELWRKHQAYDPQRGSWRTFSERVVANRMTSLVRAMRSERSGQFREEPIENLLGLAAPNIRTDLRADVSRVLAGLSPFDRSVALCLVGHSAIETSPMPRCFPRDRLSRHRTAPDSVHRGGLIPVGA